MNLPRSLSGLALATTLGFSPGVEAHRDVKVFTQLVTTRNAANIVLMTPSFCNFSLTEINGRTKYMTALHCIDDTVSTSNSHDITLLDALPPGSMHEDITDARIHKISPYTAREVTGKTLTIKGFFPSAENLNKRKMFTLTGKTRYNSTSGEVEMMIGKFDFQKMLEYAKRQCVNGNYYLSCMSGSVVLDDQDRAFGVVSTNQVMCLPFQIDSKIYTLNIHRDTYVIGITSLQSFLQKNK